jgi:integrase
VGNRWENLSRIKTKFTGVYYRESTTNNKPDKTYYIRYKDNNNKTVETKIGKFSEGVREVLCHQKRNEIITKLRLGEEPPVAAKKKKRKINYLGDIATQYFNQRKDNETTKSDKAIFEHYISPHFEDADIIDKNDIDKFDKYLQTAKQKQNEEKNLSLKYQNDIKGLLSSINKYGLKHDLTKNDFSKYIQKVPIDNARERFLTIEEIKELYKYFESDSKMLLFLKIALTTGARLNTILNIAKKDIDFKHLMIMLKDFKNNTTYKNFLTEEVSQLLEEHTKSLKLNEKIFTTNPQSRLLNTLDSLFNQEIDGNDTKNKVVIHTLRHTFASHLAINGTPIYTIQKLMNHKDISMTLRYAKLAPDSGRDSVVGLKF